MSRAIVVRSLLPKVAIPGAMLLATLVLTACSAGSMNPGGGPSWNAVGPSGSAAAGRTSLETQAACRQRTSELFDKRNRPEIYAANPSTNSPFSGNFEPSLPGRGLSGQFAYEQTQAECERGAGTDAGRTVTAPAPPPARPAAKVR